MAVASLSARPAALPAQRRTGAALGRRPLAPLAALGSGRAGYVAFNSPNAGASFFGAAGPSFAAAHAAASPAPEPAASTPAAPPPAKGPSKARLPALDSLRFFLIAYIAVGHFVAFATKDPFLLRLLTQVNVWVGPFFVLSGYVAGYTATELAKYEASPRVQPAAAYTVARVAGYYPLFALVQVGALVRGAAAAASVPACQPRSAAACFTAKRAQGVSAAPVPVPAHLTSCRLFCCR